MIVKFPVYDRATATYDLVPVDITSEADGRLAVKFDYCPPLVDAFKSMQGARWLGHDKKAPRKVWIIDDSARNKFRMDSMRWLGYKDGKPVLGAYNPYARYDAPIIDVPCSARRYQGQTTPYYDHQPEGVAFVVTRRQCILAWDMGTGKTLVIGTAMEWAKTNLGWEDEDFWFVCKNGALYQVMLDFLHWEIQVRPKFMSYEQMKILVDTWPAGKPAPKFVVFDESTLIKGPTSQRSIAALHLADSMRTEWGQEAFIVCMTGTPSPKNPCDWWHQVEVPCPGFLKEGDYNKFRKNLAIVQLQQRGDDGGFYNAIKKDVDGNQVWLDDERRCGTCGEFKDKHPPGHKWVKSINQVARINDRLKGMVSKKKKEDCLDLPERVYRIIKCRPTHQVLNAARLISKGARGAADALVRLRELSDGFQYQEVEVERVTCKMCAGSKTMVAKQDPQFPGLPPSDEALAAGRLVDFIKECDECQGLGDVPIVKREAARVPCPKDDVLEGLIEEHDDVGRLPTYCGFTGSVDRVVDVFIRNKWHVIRVDGRGWHGFAPEGGKLLPSDGKMLYHVHRFGESDFPKLALVAQASTAAHGLNFDNCPTIVNYSRDFNFENALQGDERNMRGKIKETLAKHKRTHCTVVEIQHLPSDEYISENHKKKRRLQSLTLGEVVDACAREPVGIPSEAAK